MDEIKKKISNALRALGYNGGKVALVENDSFTFKVFLSGKYIGLWDTTKDTFVD